MLYSKRNTKPFCKVCHDAGLPEKEYTSHYVKSEPGPNGKVICPTLLSQECRFCFSSGHTERYCPVIAENNKTKRRMPIIDKKKNEQREKNNGNTYPINRFSCLNISDDNTRQNEQTIKEDKNITLDEDFPALTRIKSVANIPKPAIIGYANVAAKKPDEYDNKKYEQKLIEKSIRRQLPQINRNVQRKIVCEDFVEDDDDDDDSWEQEEAKFINKQGEIMKKTSLLDWYESDEEDHW
jgi:hypothetical protein